MQILEIVVNDRGNCLFKTKEFSSHGIGIANVKKVAVPQKPKVLLVTADNVEMFNEDDTLYQVNTTTWKKDIGTVTGAKTEYISCKGTWVSFSTEEARETWILRNKPMFSIADVEAVWNKDYANNHTGVWYTKTLPAMAKERLKA